MFFLLFFAQKKNISEKGRSFDKNHVLTPLQNVVFFNFVRTSLLRSKKLYFFPRISKNVTFWLFLLKKIHIRKTSIFWRKQWTNPFPKCRYFLTLLELHFSGVNSILLFYPEYKEMFLSGLFCSKKKTFEKRSIFWQKPWTNLFAKCRFLRDF